MLAATNGSSIPSRSFRRLSGALVRMAAAVYASRLARQSTCWKVPHSRNSFDASSMSHALRYLQLHDSYMLDLKQQHLNATPVHS